MHIALFGGTFDPPHRGHVAIARAAADGFQLDEVLFAPAGRQPLKDIAAASFEDRLAMTSLACADDRRFRVSALDAPRPDGEPNYTLRTLERLRAMRPGHHLFAIAGADSFSTLPHWRDPHALLALAEWIVVSRPGYDAPGEFEPGSGLVLSAAEKARIHPLRSVHEDVSATDLRTRLRLGDPCADLLAPAVSTYIRQHRLYLADTAGEP